MFGYYCDRKPYTQVMAFSGFVSCILALALWGFAHDLQSLLWFAVLFASIVSIAVPLETTSTNILFTLGWWILLHLDACER